MMLEHPSQPVKQLSPTRSRISHEIKQPVQAGFVRRLAKFILLLGVAILIIFCLLPALTNSVPILARMADYLDNNGIDPTRYYYTDVEQVKEAELYLRSVLGKETRQ